MYIYIYIDYIAVIIHQYWVCMWVVILYSINMNVTHTKDTTLN